MVILIKINTKQQGSIHCYNACLMSFLFPILHLSIFWFRHRLSIQTKGEKETVLWCIRFQDRRCNSLLGWVSVALLCLFSPSLTAKTILNSSQSSGKEGAFQISFTLCYTNPQRSTMADYHYGSLIRFRFFWVGLMLLIPSQSQLAMKKGSRT